MKEKETGGPAYPTQSLYNNCGVDEIEYQDGMTLRDYFAGQAMMNMRCNLYEITDNASWCYEMADVMIKERNK